jgi:beta-lactamase superfamily II metal-dependent hydrolase
LTLVLALIYLLHGAPPAQTELTFLNVGTGDALLVRDVSGQSVLIDAGNGKQALLAQLGAALPFWSRSLNLLVLTGAEGTHAGAAAELAGRYTFRQVLLPVAAAHPSLAAVALRAALAQGAISLAPLDTGDLRTTGGVTVSAQSVGAAGAPHLLVFVRIGAITVLDAAALTASDERRLLLDATPLRAAVLIVPRGGAGTALDPAFLAAVQPNVILAAALPPHQTAADLGPAQILRTDQVGAVRLSTDGRTLTLE